MIFSTKATEQVFQVVLQVMEAILEENPYDWCISTIWYKILYSDWLCAIVPPFTTEVVVSVTYVYQTGQNLTISFQIFPFSIGAILLTSDPYSLISLLSDMAVSDVVTVAVKIDIITSPMRTQMKANVRASTDRGARSPYLKGKQRRDLTSSFQFFIPLISITLLLKLNKVLIHSFFLRLSYGS